MQNRTRPIAAILATATLTTGLFLAAPSAAADPEPIPCSPGACEPAPPCDPQQFVNLWQQIHRLEGQKATLETENARLRQRLDDRRELIARLRARLHRNWS